jgi:hypothetical protein
MYQDYTDGSGDNKFEWNVTLHGPILGLGIEFSWFNYKKIMWHPAYVIHCRSSIGLYAPGPTNPDWPPRTN